MEKLQAYKIGSDVIGVDKLTWTELELNGNKPFISSNSIDSSYEDISSILNWHTLGNSTGEDYNFIRERIQEIVFQVGFPNLSQEEKIIAAKLYLVGKSDRDIVLTEAEQVVAWDSIVENSLRCRQDRWSKAKSFISYNLTPMDSSDLAISTSELCLNYINYNITRNSTNGIDGLYDFLEGTSGYSSSGFPSKIYWTQSYQDRIMSYLTKGK
jgi:hypothetical protein